MRRVRRVLFWVHLVVGVGVGLDVALLAATGLILSFEHPLVALADRDLGRPPEPHARRLPIDDLLARAAALNPGLTPTSVAVRAGPNEPVAVEMGKDGVVLLNPYTGARVGPAATMLRTVFRTTLAVHRSLALSGSWRPAGRAVTGAATIGLAVLIGTGVWLWLPRRWTWSAVRPVLLPNLRLKGKARDWNWHHVAGILAVGPLLAIVTTGLVIHYPWAGALLYRAAGAAPPAPARAEAGPRSGGTPRADRAVRRPAAGRPLDDIWSRGQADHPGWTTLTMRLKGRRPADAAPTDDDGPEALDGNVVLVVTTGDPDVPAGRTTLTVARRTGVVVATEPFASLSLARRLRLCVVPLHRGEILGTAGRIVAALACMATLVLVYTGLALTWRRLARSVAHWWRPTSGIGHRTAPADAAVHELR